MQKVSIETSQNVDINYHVAGIGDRIGAFLLDLLIIIAYYILVFVIFVYGGIVESNYFNDGGNGVIAVFTIIGFPPFFYHLVSEIFMNGQSVGKMQMKIKVVKLDGTQASLGAYLLRWIIRPIDTFFYGAIAIMCILVGGKGQRLGDIAAGTAVIKMKAMTRTDKHKVVKSLGDESYDVIFNEVEKLTEKDIRVIGEVLKVYRTSANMNPVTQVTTKIKNLLAIESEMSDVKFLNTILKDYNYLEIHGR